MNHKEVVFESLQFDFYWTPKSSSTEEEYEDAFSGPNLVEESIRVCIADGATESQFAKEWARHLCDSFCSTSPRGTFLDVGRTNWAKEVGLEREDRNWYQQQSLDGGAYATFLGLTIDKDSTLNFDQFGDCNAFISCESSLEYIWPISDISQFGNMPDLLSSHKGHAHEINSNSLFWKKGGVILLATDAVSKYILEHCSLSDFNRSGMEVLFESIMNERGASLSDDDLTLLTIRRLDD